ncbi:CNH domain-containing protein [Russula emetica]|nr:CNH domain-containing protein [Russula emetica]
MRKVLNKDDGSWTPILSGLLACKDSAGKNSWRDGHCALLDSHLVFLENETSPSGPTKSSHIFRPIPLEYLRLASFNDNPEMRKHPLSLLKRVGSCFRSSPTKEQMYPFTIYHVAAKITRRHTLYTKSGTERNRWNVALESAIRARKSQEDARMLYEPKVLNDDFFKIEPRIKFNRGTHYTGRIVCAASFSFEGEDYIAVGCTSGIYLSKHAVDYSFRKVLEFNEPNSVVAVPEFNKLIVHCELELFSYSLELAIRVSQGDASSKLGLDNSEEKLAQEHGNVLFFKAGRIADRTLIVYASKASKEVTLRTFELTHQGQGPKTPANPRSSPRSSYQPSGPPMPIPEEPHDATFFDDKVAICTPKAIYMVEPMNAADPCHKVVSNSEHDASAFQRLLKRTKTTLRLGKSNTPKILDLVGKASILGVVTRGNNMFAVYNDLGCLVNQAGQPADSNYYIEWERKATAFARRGPHLLLFSPGYIEVRNIDTGKLVRMVEANELRLLCSGLTDWLTLVAAVTTRDSDGGHTEKVVELVYCG